MKTFSELISSLLNYIPDKYDKTEGSFIYDSVSPVAKELEISYQNLDKVSDKLDIENLEGDELEQYVYQRTGIERLSETYATGELTVLGNGTVTEGDLFETESGIQFEATETVTITETGTVNIKAVIPGPSGNVPAEQITLMPITISGITSVSNPEATSNGFEAETDEALLTRYYERRRTPATSGNKAHYVNWAKEVAGVGGAKVFPLWNGDNTVKIRIINADKQPGNSTLVDDVQEYIDPLSEGKGEGQAPIGAYCTVESAVALNINVEFTVVKDTSVDDPTRQINVENNITEYLKSIAFVKDYVDYGSVGAAILSSEGVEGYSNLTINTGTSNISIADTEVAVLGTVTINE
jgi:uncharacterized phage protein gp47/JayE